MYGKLLYRIDFNMYIYFHILTTLKLGCTLSSMCIVVDFFVCLLMLHKNKSHYSWEYVKFSEIWLKLEDGFISNSSVTVWRRSVEKGEEGGEELDPRRIMNDTSNWSTILYTHKLKNIWTNITFSIY